MKPGHIDAELLTCWKEIAQYLGKGVRTVQRWEREFGLPVRRLPLSSGKGAVIARPHELDAWLEERWFLKPPNVLEPNIQVLPPLREALNVEMLQIVRAQVEAARDLRSKQEELLGHFRIALHGLMENCTRLAGQGPV